MLKVKGKKKGIIYRTTYTVEKNKKRRREKIEGEKGVGRIVVRSLKVQKKRKLGETTRDGLEKGGPQPMCEAERKGGVELNRGEVTKKTKPRLLRGKEE